MSSVRSWHQRLVRGAENHGKHVGEMGKSKRDCVRGCLFGAASTATVNRDNLPPRKVHNMILTKAEKKDVIEGVLEITNTLKEECTTHCGKACRKDLNCSKACVSGCKFYVDFLKDNY